LGGFFSGLKRQNINFLSLDFDFARFGGFSLQNRFINFLKQIGVGSCVYLNIVGGFHKRFFAFILLKGAKDVNNFLFLILKSTGPNLFI
jgi:hypothetical protein